MPDPFISIELRMRLSDWEKLLEVIDTEGYPIEHFIRDAIIKHYRNEDLKELARTK